MRNRGTKILNSFSRGQSVLELAFYLVWFCAFFVICYIVYMTFEISQKQTMLLRLQAFIELGNHADFSKSVQGRDRLRDPNSRVVFALGEKTKYTGTDLDKNKNFKEAVAGKLRVDVGHAVDQDEYWSKYRFPRKETDLVWLQNGFDSGWDIKLSQTLAIANNRSLNLNKSVQDPLHAVKTGMFSGSISFKDYATVANYQIAPGEGLLDNLDAVARGQKESLRELVRRLVQNNSSLSDKAKNIEKTLNVSDSLSGGAQASLINMAIQAAMEAGLSAVKNAVGAIMPPSTSSGTTQAAKSGAQQAVTPTQYLQQLGNSVGLQNNGMQAAMQSASGQALNAPLQTVLSPIVTPVMAAGDLLDSAKDITTGLANDNLVQNLPNSFLSMTKGASEVGQVAQMGMGFAGERLDPNVSFAASVAALPSQINAGINNFTAASENISKPGGMGDVIGAFHSIAAPVMSVAQTADPKDAQVLQIANLGMTTAGATVGAIGAADNLASGRDGLGTPRMLDDTGKLFVGAGTLTSLTSTLLHDPNGVQAGAMLMTAGQTVQMAGLIEKTAIDLKAQGLDLNAGQIPAAIVKANLDSAKQTLQNFGNEMKDASGRITSDVANIFGPVKLDDNGKQLFDGAQQVVGQTTNGWQFATMAHDPTSTLNAAYDNTQKVLLNQLANASPEDALQMKADLLTYKAALDNYLQNPNSYDPTTVEAGIAALNRLNANVANYFTNTQDSKTEVMSMVGGSSQLQLEKNLVTHGGTFKDVTAAENMLKQDEGAFLFNVQALSGGNRTLQAVNLEETRAAEIARINMAQQAIKGQTQIQFQNQKTDGLINISKAVTWDRDTPLLSDRPATVRDNAKQAAMFLQNQLDTRTDLSDSRRSDINDAITHYLLISNHEYSFIDSDQWMTNVQKQLDAMDKGFKAAKSNLSFLIDFCAKHNCCVGDDDC